MNNKEIDSNILVQDISLDGLDFPPGYSVNTENLKLVNGKKEGKVKVFSSKKVVLALLQFHADLLEGFCIFKNEKGHKIKVSIRFKGREMAHPELGKEVLLRFAKTLENIAVIEQNPKLEGRLMTMILAPLKEK